MQTNAIIPSSDVYPKGVLEAFFRQKKLFFWTIALILLATALVTILTRRQYVSEMKFLVQNARENVVVTAERTTPSNVVGDVTETQVNSELEILHSHDVIDPVADPAWANTPEDHRSAAATRQHEKRIEEFEKRLGAEPARRTNIINVTLTADSPQEARADLERLSAAYLAEHRRLQRPTGATEFFASEAEKNRKAWDEANQKLVDFQQQNQVLSLGDRNTSLNAEITKDENELRISDATLKELDARIAESDRQLAQIPGRQVTVEKAIPNQESVQHLNTLIVELENRRTALLTNYKASDRTVVELDKQIATTKAALNDATVTSAHEKTTDVDPAWQQVHTAAVQTHISRKATAEHRASIAAQLAALRGQLSGSQDKTVEFSNLESRANEMKENYQLYAQKRDQAQIEDAMDEHKLMNVAVAEAPTLSSLPIRPRKLTNLLLGGVTSLFIGFCAVYFAEAGRSTIATPRELDNLSRYAVLATVPNIPELSGEFVRTTDREGHSKLDPTIPLSVQPLQPAFMNFKKATKV